MGLRSVRVMEVISEVTVTFALPQGHTLLVDPCPTQSCTDPP